jgi:hypothetical protein
MATPEASSGIPLGGTQPEQQATAAQGTDIISSLIGQAREADKAAAQATRLANIPVAGGHTGPGTPHLPGSPTDATRYQIDTNPVVGHHNATMKGAVDVAKGVANLLGQVDQAKNAKTTQRLAVNIEGLMNATASMDQAKQVLAQDPNNAAAKTQLQKAQARADEILSDDKVRKDITKAYNINFTDPSKNNTPQHAALKQATDSYSKQFQDQLPTQMQPNQAAINNAQAAQIAAKATHDMVDKIVPSIIASQSRQNVADTAATARTTAATIAANAKRDAQQAKDEAYLKGQNIHALAMTTAAKTRAAALRYEADKRLEGITGGKSGTTPKEIADATRSFDSLNKFSQGVAQNINQLKQVRDDPKTSPDQIPVYDALIRTKENLALELSDEQTKLAQKLAKLNGVPQSELDKLVIKPDSSGVEKKTFIDKIKDMFSTLNSATSVKTDKKNDNTSTSTNSTQRPGTVSAATQAGSVPTADSDDEDDSSNVNSILNEDDDQ